MKKILLMMVLAALVFAGCSKDDEPNNNAEIEASAWSKDNSVFKDESLGLGIDGKGHYSYSTTTSNPEFFIYDLKWVYKKPNIEIKFKDDSNFGSGYIDGNKMYLGEKGTYTRHR